MSELKIGARYKRWRQVGAHRAYRMCHVLAKTERGWLIDRYGGRDQIRACVVYVQDEIARTVRSV